MPGNKQKYLTQDKDPYPHMGRMLHERIKASPQSFADVARSLGVNQIVLSRYFGRPSVQAAIVWKIGLAIKHNFFTELSAAFPHQVPDEAAEARVAEKDARIADLEKELAIYKGIVMAKGG